MESSLFHLLHAKSPNSSTLKTPEKRSDLEVLKQKAIIDGYVLKGSLQKNVINTTQKENKNTVDAENSQLKSCSASLKAFRTNIVVSYTAKVIMEAPNVLDDFYSNLLDWSDKDKLAVAIQQDIFLYDHSLNKTSGLDLDRNTSSPKLDGSYLDEDTTRSVITSVKWQPAREDILALGYRNSALKVWHTEKETPLLTFHEHDSRVTSIDWKAGGSVLSSGDKNGVVLLHDLRSKQVANKLEFHKDDVCGLKWDKSGQFLASGSEDTTVLIWDWRTLLKPLIVFTEHRAAVKAIDWCSWKSGLIATGSGRMDGSIKTWSIYQDKKLKTIPTDFQVSGVSWCEPNKSIIASYEEHISEWKYPSLSMSSSLADHAERTLCLSKSKSDLFATLSSDENLHIWDCYQKKTNNEHFSHNISPISTKSLSNFASIR